jgi:hypothetical protein
MTADTQIVPQIPYDDSECQALYDYQKDCGNVCSFLRILVLQSRSGKMQDY